MNPCVAAAHRWTSPSSSPPGCPLCGAVESKTRFSFPEWSIVECRRCSMAFAQPFPEPEELRELYAASYFDGEYNAEQNYVEAGDPIELWKASLDWIGRKHTPGRLLDIGAGLGFFVRAASAGGWDASGLELSEWAAEYAREKVGANVTAGSLATAGLPPGSFDVVTLWSTLEHVTEPVRLLRQAYDLLTAGGLLCVGVPNYRGWPVRVHGARASDLKREHLLYFTSLTLRQALERAGFSGLERMLFYGGTDHSLPANVLQYALRLTGISSQLMVAARRP